MNSPALVAFVLLAVSACSSGSSSGSPASGGTPGGGGTAASGGTAAGGGGTGGASASGGSGGGSGGASGTAGSGGDADGGANVNGCDPAAAENHLQDANVDIHFPGSSLPYAFTPKCIRVAKGATVTFIPDPGVTFSDHAVYGGTKVDGTAPPDPTSPIGPKDSNDSTPLVVTLSQPGAFGYYCPYHGYLGETGAIFV